MQLFIIVYIIARFLQKVHSGRVVNDCGAGKKRWFLVGGREKPRRMPWLQIVEKVYF